MSVDPFAVQKHLRTKQGDVIIWSLPAYAEQDSIDLARLPFSIRILFESILRQVNGKEISEADVRALAAWSPNDPSPENIPFLPARVIMQDFTGVPAVVDLAAMRSALSRLGGDPARINPHVPVDLVIDHSVQVDFFASQEALQRNAELEFQRNHERYTFLRWGQEAFEHFRVVPPATGIVHQVNLEYLASVVITRTLDGQQIALPDTVVGTDSHTTMINGLGVLGWGVGGIEAEAAMLGQPLVMPAPQVVGFKMSGDLSEGITATDLVLTITQMLRERGVVGKLVEFFGPGLGQLSLPDRATIANMAPEYGATAGYFPVDEETLRYLNLTGRHPDLVDLVERYTKEQGLFRFEGDPDPAYSDLLELDLAAVETSMAGPRRPQDRVPLSRMRDSFREKLIQPTLEGGYAKAGDELRRSAQIRDNGNTLDVSHGMIVIAAITSCTNTSNPSVMIGAGLLAKKALERGLKVKPYVKTSLAPGSRVVTAYLEQANLLQPLSDLGFNVVGFGCTTCIGNSGPLPGEVVKAIGEADLVSVAVLSGNRNFEGRINPHVRANYLGSPPLVVAYALAGTADIDLMHEPLGQDQQGNPVYLHEIWPSSEEIKTLIDRVVQPEMYRSRYADVFSGNETWNAIPVTGGEQFEWDPESSYIQEPPFFIDMEPEPRPITDIQGGRVLVLLGDSVTTDHISPAGAIPSDSPAGEFLINRGIPPREFNSFGSRRGNDRVMTRGTFGNIRLKNLLVPGVEGGFTHSFLQDEQMTIYAASQEYQAAGIPLIILAGKEYGTGSSRDWAAKGTLLLGVKAVIAESYERIHRSNLVGMGVLPLEFLPGENVKSLGLSGEETFSTHGLSGDLVPGAHIDVEALKVDGSAVRFRAKVRIDTAIEVEYYRNEGILHTVLRQIAREN